MKKTVDYSLKTRVNKSRFSFDIQRDVMSKVFVALELLSLNIRTFKGFVEIRIGIVGFSAEEKVKFREYLRKSHFRLVNI